MISNIEFGAVVPIPIFPPVVNKDPIVFEFPRACKIVVIYKLEIVLLVISALVIFAVAVVNPVLKFNVPALLLVLTTFVKVVNPVAFIVPVVNPDITLILPDDMDVTFAFKPDKLFTLMLLDVNPVEIKFVVDILVTEAFVKDVNPDALILPVDNPDVIIKFARVSFVAEIFVNVNPVALIVPVVNPVVTIKFVSVSFVAEIFVKVVSPVALIVPVVNPVVTIKVASVSFVAITFVKFVNSDAFILPVLKLFKSKFVDVILFANTLLIVLPNAIKLPEISNDDLGFVVLIPIFPAVVNRLPSVLLFELAEKNELAKSVPADTFVFTKF